MGAAAGTGKLPLLALLAALAVTPSGASVIHLRSRSIETTSESWAQAAKAFRGAAVEAAGTTPTSDPGLDALMAASNLGAPTSPVVSKAVTTKTSKAAGGGGGGGEREPFLMCVTKSLSPAFRARIDAAVGTRLTGLTYLADNTFLVRFPRTAHALEQLKQLSDVVEWVGDFKPTDKLDPALISPKCPSDLGRDHRQPRPHLPGSIVELGRAEGEERAHTSATGTRFNVMLAADSDASESDAEKFRLAILGAGFSAAVTAKVVSAKKVVLSAATCAAAMEAVKWASFHPEVDWVEQQPEMVLFGHGGEGTGAEGSRPQSHKKPTVGLMEIF